MAIYFHHPVQVNKPIMNFLISKAYSIILHSNIIVSIVIRISNAEFLEEVHTNKIKTWLLKTSACLIEVLQIMHFFILSPTQQSAPNLVEEILSYHHSVNYYLNNYQIENINGSFTKPRMCTILPNPVFSMAPITTVQRTRSQNLVCNSQ